MIRVRFAPSPTGYLHIGGARTALFNYLYARNQKGQFLLRIEDTDRLRSKPEYEKEILDSLSWLGLSWDEELVYQSQRLHRYQEVAQQLLSGGLAYEETRDGKQAVLFRVPREEVIVHDMVRGPVRFDSREFGDIVLLKSDGFPAYHFACVVDDHDMGITHVIRGDDHLPNTPRHLLLYRALGWKPPKHAHLPLILGQDGAPLSKRHGAVALTEYRRQGFLPEGLLNYFALLGWGDGSDREVFTLPELCKKFSLKRIHKSGARFSREKLLWVNSQHMRNLSEENYISGLAGYYPEESGKAGTEKWKKVARLYRTRIRTFGELTEEAPYLFLDVRYNQEDVLRQYTADKTLRAALAAWRGRAERLKTFEDEQALETLTRNLAAEQGLQAKDLIHPLRFILTGKTVSPGLFELMNVLGKEVCLKRLKSFLEEVEKVRSTESGRKV